MIPLPDTTFVLRLETNEMIERGRLAEVLAAIEGEVRKAGFAGPQAILLVGGVRHGSVELTIAIAGLAVAMASAVLAIPGFLVSLRQLSRDPREEPNPFAVAMGEVMGFDGVNRADFRYGDKLVSILREEVPFAQRIRRGEPMKEAASTIEVGAMPDEPADEWYGTDVEDEDRDWVSTLEAADFPPREAGGSPTGYIASLPIVGEFETARGRDGATELRFVPRDRTLAQYFVVTSNAYEAAPSEMVDYEVVGNVNLDADGPATIDVISIGPPEDALLTTRR